MQTASRHIINAQVIGVRTSGDSMRPCLPVGETPLLFDARPPSGYQIGDVVLYGGGAARAVHRIFWKTRAGFWVGDDAGRMAYHFVPLNEVHGRLAAPCPQGRIGFLWGLFFRAFYISGRMLKNF